MIYKGFPLNDEKKSYNDNFTGSGFAQTLELFF